MLKTYQFKTHCKGDSHSSKTANIILPGLMIKQESVRPRYGRTICGRRRKVGLHVCHCNSLGGAMWRSACRKVHPWR